MNASPMAAFARLFFFLFLCLVCHIRSTCAETYRIALVHSYEPGYSSAEATRKMLQEELHRLGITCIFNEYFLDCDRYEEEPENRRMTEFVKDISAWKADLVAVLDDQATYALMACGHPYVHKLPIVFSGVNYPNLHLLKQYPNITGYADTPDYLRTISMVKSIMGNARICLMNGQTFLDRKIWHALNKQCTGSRFNIVPDLDGAYFDKPTYRHLDKDDKISPLMKRRKQTLALDATTILRMSSDSVMVRYLMWLGQADNTLFLYTKRDYTTQRVAPLFNTPTFQSINEGFGFSNYRLGGYFTPLEEQIKYMAAGIKERINKKMPPTQVIECEKQYVLNWHALQKYGFSVKDIPHEYTVMYIPFTERYRYYILTASILGGIIILSVIITLFFSLRRERKRKREAVRNLHYEHETLCLAIEGNSTYAWRMEGDYVSCDPQFCKFIHKNNSRFAISSIFAYIHPDDLPAFRRNMEERDKTPRYKGQYRCNFSGEYQWWEFSYTTIQSSKHTPVITGLMQNIQEIKDHEQELIRMRELAEHAELKQSFLNNMSHEIRTPLNAIVGFSDMLVNEPDFSNEERKEFADIINTNTKLLLKLVDDVLELSRIESGNLSFAPQRINVRKLLDEVYHTHSLLIHPPLQFVKEFANEDVEVKADPLRLMQVLTNFLNNANKFTENGNIRLGYHCTPCTREVHLYVEDTGIGIPQSEQKIIFERFYKRSEFSQGVGLGLSICVVIAEKMGGRIELHSEEGKGSRFTVVLPYCK